MRVVEIVTSGWIADPHSSQSWSSLRSNYAFWDAKALRAMTTDRRTSRRRGAILTEVGERKLQAARHAAEEAHNFGDRFTNEELAKLTRLSLKTIAKLFSGANSVSKSQIPVDKQTLELCFAAFNLRLERSDYIYPGATEPVDLTAFSADTGDFTSSPALGVNPAVDRGEAPDVSVFYGRVAELAKLVRWVERDRCKLVALLGMGGIGKTSLVTKLTQQLQPQFKIVVWRSLRNAPLLKNLLAELIQIFSHHTETIDPNLEISAQISRLIHYFASERCLLVLDNVEAIVPSQNDPTDSDIRQDYPGYEELLRRIGDSPHQSCLLLTSREKPEVLVPLEGKRLAVRTLMLSGLTATDSENLFTAKGISTSVTERARLVGIYSGNPLALNIVSTSICELFAGNIDEFLATEVTIFGGIEQLLDRQFDRLAPEERVVMYWLTIEREAISPIVLHQQIVPATTKARLLATLESLRRRSLIERCDGKFTQQAVVMEYMTVRFIDRVCRELVAWDLTAARPPQIPLWLSYPWLKAQSPEYLHAVQTRSILKPIACQLQLQFGNKSALAERLKAILASLRVNYRHSVHYGGGNLFNLLRYLQIDLTGYNFAELPMWQADLQNAVLHDVNLSGTDLSRAQFTQNFGGIFALAVSPDNRLLLMGEYSGNLYLWQLHSKQLQHKLVGHTNWIWSVAFSPDGRTIASASQDGTVRVWELETDPVADSLRHRVLEVDTYHVLSLAFSPIDFHGERLPQSVLATAHGDGKIRLWDLTTDTAFRTIEAHAKQVYSVRFSPDGKIIATSGDEPAVKIWDARTGELIRAWNADAKRVWSVRFSPDGRWLATCGGDGTIKIWEVATWTIAHVLTGYRDWIYAVCFSPDSQMLATGSSGSVVKIWDLRTTQKICTLRGHTTWVATLQFSPDGKLLVSGSGDRSVRLWDTHTWQELYHWQGYTNWVESVAFEPTTGTKLVSGGQDGIAKVWDVSTGEIRHSFPGHQQGLWSVDYSPDGKILATGSADSTVKLWDMHTGELLRTLSIERGDVWRVKFSPDGRSIAGIGTDSAVVYLWSLTGDLITTFGGHTNLVRAIAFSPDGRFLATGSFDSCWRLWEVATSQLLGCYVGHTNWIWDLAFSPDGKLLASCSADRTVRLWDLATGETTHILEGHTQEVVAVQFSPSGYELASSSGDRTIKIWQVETGALLQTSIGHVDRVLSICYSPDGTMLASGSADETIKFWDVTTGTCILTCKPPAPYMGMKIAGVTGLPAAAIESLKTLGAISTTDV
jgi:WD40 repeat protein/ABC-type dipeptide/oligopeptide/nickel transport system ATPase subunit